jgi:TonB family protein
MLIGVLAAALAASRTLAQQPEPKASAVRRVGGEIREPRKLKNVPPVYPEEAKKAGVQGVVILECTISPEGKVVDVRVLRGIPLLDPAAVEAVKQWEYTPTLLEGKPVPVIMTVTVNFRLGSGPPAPAVAEAPPAPALTGSPEKIADIRRFLELSGAIATLATAREMMVDNLRALARPETPSEVWEELRALIEAEHLEDDSLPLYDKYFTHDEIREYIRFYETPSGRKLAATLPVLVQEQVKPATSRATQLLKKLLDRLRSGGYLKS